MRLSEWIKSQPDYAYPSSFSSPLPALYADLAAHRGSNRSSFDASVSWWKDVLSTACMAGVQPTATSGRSMGKGKEPEVTRDRLVLHVDQILLDELTVDDVGRPLGLGTVIRELQSCKHFIGLPSFLSSQAPLQGPASTSHSLPSRLASFAASPLIWAMAQLSLNLGLGQQDRDASEEDWREARGDWVIWDNVTSLADAVLEKYRAAPRLSSLECLFSRQTFRDSIVVPALESISAASVQNVATLSERDFTILLKHLARDRGVAAVEEDVVKMEREHGQNMHGVSISEHERGIVTVRDTHAKLEGQIEEIERRIKERQAKVEKSLKEGSKPQALSYLRSRKMLESLLDKRVGALESLHGVLVKIEQAASDVEIMKAYELSTSSLKTLLGDARLQPDRIDSSMEAMQDTLANADEVRQAVEAGQEGMRRAAGIEEDQDEMEAELAALQQEVEREGTQTERHDKPAEVQSAQGAGEEQREKIQRSEKERETSQADEQRATSQDNETDLQRQAEPQLAT